MSPWPVVTFPDAERVIGGWLRTALAGNTAPPRVVSELPANLETVLPLVQVVRSGGAVNVALVQDRPRLDIDVYAADRGTAKDLARQIQGLLPTMRNVTTGGAVVGDVAEESGPSYRPDYNPNVRRIGMTYRCTLRPA